MKRGRRDGVNHSHCTLPPISRFLLRFYLRRRLHHHAQEAQAAEHANQQTRRPHAPGPVGGEAADLIWYGLDCIGLECVCRRKGFDRSEKLSCAWRGDVMEVETDSFSDFGSLTR
jgi:hypothetical protein